MKRIILVLLLFFFSGCMVSKEAIRIRTELAVDTQKQLDQSAIEIDGLIKVIISEEADKAYTKLQEEYDTTYNAVSTLYKNNPDLLSKNIAILSANYIKGQEKTRENLEAEATRLSVISTKVEAGSKAVEAINKMADDEIMLVESKMSQFMSVITSKDIEEIIQSIEAKHYSVKLKETK